MYVETCSTTDIFNITLQYMNLFFLFWCQFLTWNVAIKIWFKVKIVNLESLKWVATNSLRPAKFTSPHFHERCWRSWWTHERLHLHVIICLNCSCPWKLFRQANRTRALSINQGTSQTAVIFDSQKLLTDKRALKNHKWMEGCTNKWAPVDGFCNHLKIH